MANKTGPSDEPGALSPQPFIHGGGLMLLQQFCRQRPFLPSEACCFCCARDTWGATPCLLLGTLLDDLGRGRGDSQAQVVHRYVLFV